MSLRRRLERLRRHLPDPAIDPKHCPVLYITAVVLNDDPLPLQGQIDRCRTCGGQHVLREIIQIVEPARATKTA